MKISSIMKKILISVCAVVCGVCCWNVFTAKNTETQAVSIQAQAATVAKPITIDTWNPYPGASQLYYAHLNFEGFHVKDDYEGESNSDYVLKSIKINGKSIYEINATTNVSGWKWEIFPQTAGSQYQKPVLTYTEGVGKLQLRIHKNFHDAMIAEYGALEISVDKNFTVHGYTNPEEVTLVKNSSNIFVKPTLVDTSSVTLSRWQALANKQLTYFDIKYSAFAQIDYKMMDVASYAYIGNMIEVNGVKMSHINNNTNVSGWSWLEFPSTASAIYQKPFVTLVNKGSMEVRMHDNYWNSIKENGLTVSLLPGYYIENGGTMHALSEKVSCMKDPAVTEYAASGGFEKVLDGDVYKMWKGASVRMKADSTGIRFTAQVSKAYLDGLQAKGNGYRLMMEVRRENSDNVAYMECTNFYEEGGYVFYHVAIVNLQESSYALTYTAKPYVEVTGANGNVTKFYTQEFLQERAIKDVAYLAYTDVSEHYKAQEYKALMNMAYLEDAVTANKLTVAAPTVKTTLTGADIAYTYTASQLRELANGVKTSVSAELNETAKTGYFKTFPVTVDGKTLTAGRFIDGYYGNTQIDFGAVALNLMILETGVATEEQKTQVLNWLASIDNLYEYVFAPKTNTEDIENQYCWGYAAADYGVSCQNGGAILFVSYYDILARAQVYGANNAYQRLTAIMAWLADVKTAFENSDETDAKNFFKPYYDALGCTLQGRGEEGRLGLDAEFVENALLYALVPNAFFGLDTYYEDGLVMQVAPNLPDAISTWKMERVRYAGLTYDIAVGDDFVLVCNVAELANGALSRNTKLAVTLAYTGDMPKVYINNKLVTEGYTVDTEGKTVTVTVEMRDVSIAVR